MNQIFQDISNVSCGLRSKKQYFKNGSEECYRYERVIQDASGGIISGKRQGLLKGVPKEWNRIDDRLHYGLICQFLFRFKLLTFSKN